MQNRPPLDLSPAASTRLRALAASGPLVRHADYAAVDRELVDAGFAEPYDAASIDTTQAGCDAVEAADNGRGLDVDPVCGGDPRCTTHRGGAYNMDAVGRRMECRVL